MKPVFFYGLFMDADLLKARGFAPSSIELARLAGYGLRIGERATLLRSAHELAYGSLMRLGAAELEQLYADNGLRDYVPEEVIVTTSDGTILDALTYLLPMQMLCGRNDVYAKSLAQVACKIGLPDEYLEEIENWAR